MQIQARSDLKIMPYASINGKHNFVVKDPLALKHFLFSESDLFLLQQLDGSSSVSVISQRWRDRFHSSAIDSDQVQQFAKRLVADGLAYPQRLGFGHAVNHQRNVAAAKRSDWWHNPLAIRLQGFDPTWLLKWFDGLAALVFHPLVMTGTILISSFVLIFLFGHFDDIAQRLPTIERLLSVHGIMALAATVALIKIVHELGHALALRWFGGECPEIGVMLLAFFPTLYCNVSDVWSIPHRWQRMLVSFAGMYVEIGLAAIAAVAWFWTPPSLLNALLFNVVLLCSVNTLLINGNPLLRYDGYYLLTDWLDHPDLHYAASHSIHQVTMGCFLVGNVNAKPAIGLLAFGIAAMLYRWFVLAAIIIGIVLVIGHSGSFPIGYLVGGLLLVSVIVGSGKGQAMRLRESWRKAKQNGNQPRISVLRSLVTLSVLAVGIWFAAAVPLPKSVLGVASVKPIDPIRVFAPHAGKLVLIADSFSTVSQNQVIFKIENQQLAREQQRLASRLKHLEAQIDQLKRRENAEPELSSRIGSLQETLRGAQAELELLTTEIDQLTIKTPIAGIVVPAEERKRSAISLVGFDQDRQHETWSGAVNNRWNRNCVVTRSEPLLTIVDPAQQSIRVSVQDANLDLIRAGQPVTIRFALMPERVFSGVVQEVFKNEIEVGSMEIGSQLFPGATGQAKISVAHQTIFQRFRRLVEWSLAMHE